MNSRSMAYKSVRGKDEAWSAADGRWKGIPRSVLTQGNWQGGESKEVWVVKVKHPRSQRRRCPMRWWNHFVTSPRQWRASSERTQLRGVCGGVSRFAEEGILIGIGESGQVSSLPNDH